MLLLDRRLLTNVLRLLFSGEEGKHGLLSMWNQENHFDLGLVRQENQESSGRGSRPRPSFDLDDWRLNDWRGDFFRSQHSRLCGLSGPGRSDMSGQVVLYFEDQADALRFALAAGSVMAGEGAKFTSDLVQETARVTRIRLDTVNAGGSKKANPVRVA